MRNILGNRNVLANMQKQILSSNITDADRYKREHEFYKRYYELRRKEENRFFNKLSLKTRKRIHKIILFTYTIKNHLGGHTYEVISDKRIKSDRPIIFAITHVGKFDIEVVSEAIKDHYYLLSGDYEHLQGSIDAIFLALNGVFYFNEKVKTDRLEVVNKMISHLKSGGNLMYFPEGTWNLSPNLPVLPCYWGIVEIAQKSDAIIVPIAAEQYGKHFKVNIGQNFDMNIFGNGAKEKSRAICELRDILATLKFEIWESEEQIKRREIIGDEWKRYVEKRFSEWTGFDEDYIEALIYRPKDVTSPYEAFSCFKNLIPKKENAFLFDKRLKGQLWEQ